MCGLFASGLRPAPARAMESSRVFGIRCGWIYTWIRACFFLRRGHNTIVCCCGCSAGVGYKKSLINRQIGKGRSLRCSCMYGQVCMHGWRACSAHTTAMHMHGRGHKEEGPHCRHRTGSRVQHACNLRTGAHDAVRCGARRNGALRPLHCRYFHRSRKCHCAGEVPCH